MIELPPDFSDKNVLKKVQKYNEAFSKQKWDKVEESVKDFFKELQGDLDDANPILYILSIIAEDYPESITEERVELVEPFLIGKELKPKTNAMIIFGAYLNKELNEKGQLAPEQLDLFFKLLEDENGDVRYNAAMFFDEMAPHILTILLIKLNFLVDIVLKKENEPEILKVLQKIFSLVQPKLSLTLLVGYIAKLVRLYEESDNSDLNDVLLSLLEKEIPSLIDRRKKNASKKEILNQIETRPPMIRIYDIAAIAKEEKMEETVVEQNVTAGSDESKVYVFSFSEKNRKYVIEFEIHNLILAITQSKIKLDKINDMFKAEILQNRALVPILLKSLIKDRFIRGFISKEYFYPHDYLKKEMLLRLQKEGKINVLEYNAIVNPELVQQILEEITQQGTFAGIIDKTKATFYTLKNIIQNVEKESAKSAVIDLTPYSEKFDYDSFLQIEEYGRKHLFGTYHKKHIWISNLGLTKIQSYLRTCEQIGQFSFKEAKNKLNIPEEIIKDATIEYFDHINGFWNTDKSNFYYGKFVRTQIDKIQNELNPTKREEMITQLTTDLNIDRNEIANKVNEKLNAIATKLKSQDEFEILSLLREFQMEQPDFIKFIDKMEKPYLISAGRIIFAPNKIEAEKARLKDQLEKDSAKEKVINLEALAPKYRGSKQLLGTLFKGMVDEGKIKGIWINTDNFLTETGIIQKMKETHDYISLVTFVENKVLEEKDITLLEEFLRVQIEKNQWKGSYDPESKIFQSESALNDASIENDKLRFSDDASRLIQEMELTYNTIKEILMGTDILPNQIDDYEKLLEETIRKIIQGESYLKRTINNADMKIRKKLGIAKPKKEKKSKSLVKEGEEAVEGPSFKDDETVSQLLNDFANWKTLLMAIDQKAGQLIFLKKKLKTNPDDEDSQKKFKGIVEYLGFID